MNKYLVMPIVLNQFASYINTVEGTTNPNKNDISAELKTYYSDYLIDLVEPELIHDQFAQKHPIPKNGGKEVEFRKYDSLDTTPSARKLVEGVTPDGQKLNVKTVTAKVEQYGGYVVLSDMLLLTAIDNNIVEATQLIAAQAGRTLDTVTRDHLATNTNTLTTASNTQLSSDMIRQAVRMLKIANAPKINGYYVGIVHPDVAYDLMKDDEWQEVKSYNPENWYNGELGRIAGVRFVESSTAYYDTTDKLYSTLILGANAYGVTEISGGGLQHIVKQLGYGDDPLNQRASVGWKATRAVEILVPQYMISIETKSTLPYADPFA